MRLAFFEGRTTLCVMMRDILETSLADEIIDHVLHDDILAMILPFEKVANDKIRRLTDE